MINHKKGCGGLDLKQKKKYKKNILFCYLFASHCKEIIISWIGRFAHYNRPKDAFQFHSTHEYLLIYSVLEIAMLL